MENKQYNRQSSVPPKGPASDGRKDNGSQKHQRNQKRRDPAPRTRNEPPPGRRPAPQRSRDFDKRPKSRGYNNDRQREEVTQVRRAEVGSALRPGSKKGNLNHLLNFTIRGESDRMRGRGAGRASGRPEWRGSTKYGGVRNRFNKERFLQANCQFVVREDVDYSTHAVDPDTLVEWDLIEQVRMLSNEVPTCPICLYPPTAAKLTRCGHIYCWACILHYLSLEDNSWRKCPICYVSIHQKNLKSVVAMDTHQFGQDEQIKMKLMRRERGSTYAMPRIQWTERSGKPHNIEDTVDVRYAKLLLANDDQIKKIIEDEKKELEQQIKEEGDSLEGSFVQAAMQLLNERENVLNYTMGIKGKVEAIAKNKSRGSAGSVGEKSTGSSGDEATEQPWKNEEVLEYADAFSDEIGEAGAADVEPVKELENEGDCAKNADVTEEEHGFMELDVENEEITVEEAAEELAIPTEPEKRTGGNKTTQTYYYYQAEDGQQIYLNSINGRCLLKEYGSWENCPDTITATIVEIEGVTMTLELRERLRYLSHLPVTCQFQVAELALKPPLVSTATLDCFSVELDKRQKIRQRKLREDRQRSRKIRMEENKKMGFYPRMRVNISSQRHFPGGNTETFRSVSPADTDELSFNTPLGSPPGLNPNAPEFAPGSPVSVGSSDDGSGAMSFAQMLRAGKAKPQLEAWPKVKKQGEAAGMTAASNTNAGIDDSDNEDSTPVPIFQSTFGDAIEQALNKFKKLDVDVEEPVATPAVSDVGGKKKKGKKKQLLFVTTMHRN